MRPPAEPADTGTDEQPARATNVRRLALYGGPMLALVTALLMQQQGWASPALWTGAITVLCIVWWLFEPIPIPATSLIPIAVFPLAGALSQKDVSSAYGNDLILLLLGGFILSSAMERSGAHRRIALGMVRLVGGQSSRRIVFGFLIACAAVSMWISNAATAFMMLPVALAIIERANDKQLAAPLMLAIAYGANIGGIGTPIGTPPNLVFMQAYAHATGRAVGFMEWMSWSMPIIFVLLPLTGMWLTRHLTHQGELVIPHPGQWRPDEARVLTVFALTAAAWITRTEPFGGWSELLGMTGATDAAVALTAVVLLFIIPNGRGGALLDWKTAESVPWGILLLFAGGITIASAFTSSGISAALGELLSGMADLPLLLLIAIIAFSVIALTETTSNTATATLLMPILAAAAVGAQTDPKLLMLPAVFAASLGFMLPVGTAPNAIVFGSGKVPMMRMVREGLVIDCISAVVITVVCYVLLS